MTRLPGGVVAREAAEAGGLVRAEECFAEVELRRPGVTGQLEGSFEGEEAARGNMPPSEIDGKVVPDGGAATSAGVAASVPGVRMGIVVCCC